MDPTTTTTKPAEDQITSQNTPADDTQAGIIRLKADDPKCGLRPIIHASLGQMVLAQTIPAQTIYGVIPNYLVFDPLPIFCPQVISRMTLAFTFANMDPLKERRVVEVATKAMHVMTPALMYLPFSSVGDLMILELICIVIRLNWTKIIELGRLTCDCSECTTTYDTGKMIHSLLLALNVITLRFRRIPRDFIIHKDTWTKLISDLSDDMEKNGHDSEILFLKYMSAQIQKFAELHDKNHRCTLHPTSHTGAVLTLSHATTTAREYVTSGKRPFCSLSAAANNLLYLKKRKTVL